MGLLDAKTAVITGGTSGIGLATAARFVDEGAWVFITGRRQAQLDEALGQLGERANGVRGDVGVVADLDRLYTAVAEAGRGLDTVVANAGGLHPEGLAAAVAELADAHLIAEHAPGRYAFHDLLRAYAADLARTTDPEETRQEAVYRVLGERLRGVFPAFTGVVVVALARPEWLVEIDVTAVTEEPPG